ncbi:hypothetical protein [Paractinoplanes brasiliensis]|uniref:Uncharacterized protein n=1 Tax=Paractinoplanes brasiliensis TaxID=52695 RepID=A0A4R6JN98_9ACTN|nr:hypothetical protein [Actinoplanes brasiliensis]TDO37840.1 hypothetical protein C8E87_1475 [Actinoplanes brasiliensis]GID33021.1 hypothetical protein Abr02nite_80040 [Actinoplanes brasiliensis]
MWISSAALLAALDITTLRVEGRVLPVPAHGRLVVVWSSADPPTAEACNSSDEKVATVRL